MIAKSSASIYLGDDAAHVWIGCLILLSVWVPCLSAYVQDHYVSMSVVKGEGWLTVHNDNQLEGWLTMQR